MLQLYMCPLSILIIILFIIPQKVYFCFSVESPDAHTIPAHFLRFGMSISCVGVSGRFIQRVFILRTQEI